MLPKVSIVIVNYNRKEIIECIKSVKKADYPQDKIEIIVSDNNSTDDSLSQIRKLFLDIAIIKSGKNQGYGAGCNHGAKYAHGKYMVFLTPDNIVDRKWLPNLVNKIENDKTVGTVTSKVMYLSQKNKINSMGCFLSIFGICGSINSSKYVHNSNIFAPSGASFIISRELFKKVGGFDEKLFMYSEDVDLGWRVLNLGYRNITSADSVTYHNTDITTKNKGDLFYHYNTRNNLLIIMKNATFPLIIPMMVFSTSFHLSRAIIFAMIGRMSYSKATFSGLFWILTNLKDGLRSRVLQRNRNNKYTRFITGIKDSVPILFGKVFKHLS